MSHPFFKKKTINSTSTMVGLLLCRGKSVVGTLLALNIVFTLESGFRLPTQNMILDLNLDSRK